MGDVIQRLVFFGGKLHAHAVDIFNAHLMFTRDSTDHGHAGFKDIGADPFAAVQLVRVVLKFFFRSSEDFKILYT